MNIKRFMPLLAIGVAWGLSGCATVAPNHVDAKTADPGYFLSLKQKGQLIGTGRVQDAQGIWYDVWIVPGYVKPAQRAKVYLARTGRDFTEYVQPKKYRDIAEASGDAFEWAFDDCLTDFTIKGVPRAWGRYWSAANRRTSQRVFGWWLAYPWAVLEGTVDTVVRVPVGLAGTALGTAWGAAAVPGYYAVNSTVAGTWHFAVDTVLLPTVACTWNTVVAPPMAMLGQKPAPARVDGFWVKQLTEENIRTDSLLNTPINPKDIEALAAWGHTLLIANQPYEDQRQTLQKQIQAEREAINQKAKQAEADIRREEQETVRALLPDPSQQERIEYLQKRGFDSKRISQATSDIRRYLGEQKEMSPAEINRTLRLLTRYPPLTTTNQTPLRPKTDPVEHSIQVIKDLE